MVGVDRLRLMAAELYGELDPIGDFEARSPFRVVEDGDSVTMELDVPFFEKSELDVFRHGHELYVSLGSYRRSFLLPDALVRRDITRARLDGGTLSVDFGKPARRS
jgi:arsenite-transporting ATPase